MDNGPVGVAHPMCVVAFCHPPRATAHSYAYTPRVSSRVQTVCTKQEYYYCCNIIIIQTNRRRRRRHRRE